MYLLISYLTESFFLDASWQNNQNMCLYNGFWYDSNFNISWTKPSLFLWDLSISLRIQSSKSLIWYGFILPRSTKVLVHHSTLPYLIGEVYRPGIVIYGNDGYLYLLLYAKTQWKCRSKGISLVYCIGKRSSKKLNVYIIQP